MYETELTIRYIQARKQSLTRKLKPAPLMNRKTSSLTATTITLTHHHSMTTFCVRTSISSKHFSTLTLTLTTGVYEMRQALEVQLGFWHFPTALMKAFSMFPPAL